MQYIFLKNILETILSNYICPECQNKTNEQAIQITGISSRGIDIHIHCHVCGAHSQLNAEINTSAVEMFENEEWKKQFREFLNQWWTIGAIMKNTQWDTAKTDTHAIKDEDIVKIHNDLKKAKTIEELMG